jgi:hypothetical protein
VFHGTSTHPAICWSIGIMAAFTKLSAQQWDILAHLVMLGGWGLVDREARREGARPEAGRVSRIRAYSALVRRGLIEREHLGNRFPVYKLAVPVMAVVNAADDLRPAGVDVETLRYWIDFEERQAARERRREAARDGWSERRSRQLEAVSYAERRLRHDVTACVRYAAKEGLDIEAKVVELMGERGRAYLERLKASGDYERIIAEARAAKGVGKADPP